MTVICTSAFNIFVSVEMCFVLCSVVELVKFRKGRQKMLDYICLFLCQHNHGQMLVWILWLVFHVHNEDMTQFLWWSIAFPKWHISLRVKRQLMQWQWLFYIFERFIVYMVSLQQLFPIETHDFLAIFGAAFGVP